MKVRAPLGSIARSIHFAPPMDSKYRTYIEIEIEIESLSKSLSKSKSVSCTTAFDFHRASAPDLEGL
jgi:hypothetical protein